MSAAASDKSERFLRHITPLEGVLKAYCQRSVRDHDAVLDVLQSAVTNAFRDFDLYAEGTNFRAWIFRYVTYEILNRNRATTRHRATPLSGLEVSPPADVAAAAESIEALLDAPEFIFDQCDEQLAAAIRGLPDLQRNIFLLRSVGEFKYREIAEILEVPIGTVMGLLARSRESLRNELAAYAEQHGLLPRKGP